MFSNNLAFFLCLNISVFLFRLDHQTVESIGVVVPFDQKIFGVGINERHTLSLPVRAEFALDLGNGKFSHKYTPIVPHEIFHYHTEPYTFVDSYENGVPVLQEETYYPLNGEQSQKQVSVCVSRTHSGFKSIVI